MPAANWQIGITQLHHNHTTVKHVKMAIVIFTMLDCNR
jgi:hypothetical protein